ncbi:YsnF/AvaK domain-containing protein [Roseicella sp. DB1501]|uniref:YsnF/AvaK domain-containing protein n=1 Tax=Roseicella sp. DB1501 TaxID=2730925 RepID=UPI0014911AA7|nr:YsnF/AvaK domain-containing protein [Roseicella sp. DB1501]NOG71252.1 YsnF/AvaK domain-containing protein [Roseicella sp. DB1501]
MTQTTLTALYDMRGDADTAAERLMTEAGLARSDITVTTQDAGAAEEGGFLASLKSLFVSDQDRDTYAEAVRRGGFLLTARAWQGSTERAIDILEEHGAVDIDDRQQSWRMEEMNGQQSTGAAATLADGTVVAAAPAVSQPIPPTAAASAPAANRPSETGDEKIELVEERLRVGKREVGGGRVRVRTYVVETPVEEQVSLREEQIGIERRPMDRAPTAADDALFAERVIEATETGEEAVIAKDARVTEEVIVRKDVKERVETVHDTVRRTEVEVNDTRVSDAKGNATAPASSSGRLDPASRR